MGAIGDIDIVQSKRAKNPKKKQAFLFYEDDVPTDPDELRKEKRNIYKNLLLICLSFLLNFTAFMGITNLQSSLNADGNLGTATLAIIYAALILSALFSPTLVIKHLGCKWAMVASTLGYTTYYLANFYPCWGTLAPTSIVLGLAGAPLWAAKCVYLTTAAKRFARLNGESVDTVVNRFFGLFFFIFQLNQVFGNLTSSFVLSTASSLDFPSNLTTEEESIIKLECGAKDCPGPSGNHSTGHDVIPDETLYTLIGIFTGCALLAATITAIFVSPIAIRVDESRSRKEQLIATFVHIKDHRQLLLILITMYSGFEQAFLEGDYTKSFVTCPLAVNWVGFVMICFGASDALFSFVFGRLEKYVGRSPLLTLAATINLALIIIFLTWPPLPSSPAPFFLIPAFWGIADAVWQTQLNALYGVLFFDCQEEAFANYRLWESVGFMIAFGFQGFVCVRVNIYMLLTLLIVGMSLYYVVEYLEKKYPDKKHHNRAETDEDGHAGRDVEAETYVNSRITSI